MLHTNLSPRVKLIYLFAVIFVLFSSNVFSQPNTWQNKQSFGGTGRSGAVAFSIGTKGYIGTGYDTNPTKDFWEYDSSTDTWAQKADFGGGERNHAAGFSIGNKGYIGTGLRLCMCENTQDFWEYNPATNVWTRKADFAGPPRHVAIGLSIGTKGYIGTGTTHAYSLYNDFWEYDPTVDTWTQKADFAGGARYYTAAFSISKKGYLGTGTDFTGGGFTFRKDFWEYDQNTDIWTRKADLGGTAREGAVGFNINNKGYIGTGYGAPNDFWEYDPTANTWTRKADFAGGGRFSSAAFSIGSTGYIGLGVAGARVNDLWAYSAAMPPSPVITSFTPTNGFAGTNAGTIVTINGHNFNNDPATNIVFFGAVSAAVTSASSTHLTVVAPAGATLQSLSVLDNTTGLTGYSSQPFVPTFTNPFGSGIGARYYKPHLDLAAGYLAFWTSIGDLDGDGKPDLVVVNAGDNTISVLHNTSGVGSISTASFAPAVIFNTGINPAYVSIADLDGDGKLDLAVVNRNSNTVSVYRNTSTTGIINSSSFADKVDFTTGASPYSVDISDLDLDGKPELITANLNSNSVSVLRNTTTKGIISAASFSNKVEYTAGGGNPSIVKAGDLNGDGKPEIVVANYTANSVSVLQNTSTAGTIDASSFAGHFELYTPNTPFSAAIADIDGDGKSEIAVSNLSGSISVFRNLSGLGTMGVASFPDRVDILTGQYSPSLGVADADGDSKLDLVIANQYAATVSVIRNNNSTGSITASSFAARVDFTAVGSPLSIAAGDLNGDGIPEIVVSNYQANSASVFQIDQTPSVLSFTPLSGVVGSSVTISGGGFDPVPSNNIVYFGAVKASVTSGTTATLNVIVPPGATSDYITVTTSGNLTAISNKQFNPTFNCNAPIDANSFAAKVDFAVGERPQFLSIADLDGDGKPDISVSEKLLSILRNTSSGEVISANSMAPAFELSAGLVPTGIENFDIDGDGRKDILLAKNSSNIFSVYRNISALGSLTASSFAPRIDFATTSNASGIAVNDIDMDGKPDVVVTNSQSPFTVSVFRNTSTVGVISFASKIDFPLFGQNFYVKMADMDDDGKPEIIALSGGTIKIFRNTSSRGIINASSFASPLTLSTGVNARLHDIIDLDGDGKLDIVWPNQDDNNFSVYMNTGSVGNMSFTSRINFPCGNSPVSSKCGDIDGDGKPDLVLTYITDNSVGIFKNTGTPGAISFASGVNFATGINPFSAAIADMNGDGKPELVVANYNGNSVSIFKNQINALAAPVITTSGILSCAGQTINLGTAIPYSSYLWSTDETAPTINVGAGIYSVTVTSNGCKNSSNITLTTAINQPTVSCPSNITVNAAQGQCGANVSFAATGFGTITYSHAPGSFFAVGITTVTATATTECGSTSCTFDVTVIDNEAPQARCKPVTVTLVNGTANITAADVNDNSKDNCGVQSVSVSPNTFNCSNVGTNTVTLTVTDIHGNSSTCNTTVTVVSGIPLINSVTGSLAPVAVNTPVSLNVDYSGNDVTTATINWNDGSATQTLANPIANFSISHTYNTPGVYVPVVRLTDACNQSSAEYPFQYVVVYDPTGGFVTGGGWIMSQPGSYRPEVSLTGKAHFGFESKYQRGANIPTGNTEFKFQAGSMNFKSISYEWLVVAGSKAQYKGVGTINGSGNYGFMLTAVDGNLKTPASADLFRIKIWDKNNGDGVVYDNQHGASDNDAPSTQIGGGSIVIHNPNNNAQTTAKSEAIMFATEEDAGELKLQVLGNPSSGQFTVVVMGDIKQPISLRIIDVQGKILELRNGVQSGSSVKIGNALRPGTYLVQAIQGNKLAIKTVIKQ